MALLPLLLLAACSGGDKQKTNNNAEIHPVRTMTVQPENMLRTINAVGTVRYRRETPLGFTTAGKVATVRFNEGDYVKRGALLAALDGTPTGADVSVASAELERARADFERVRSLYADGWVTKAQFENERSKRQSCRGACASGWLCIGHIAALCAVIGYGIITAGAARTSCRRRHSGAGAWRG